MFRSPAFNVKLLHLAAMSMYVYRMGYRPGAADPPLKHQQGSVARDRRLGNGGLEASTRQCVEPLRRV